MLEQLFANLSSFPEEHIAEKNHNRDLVSIIVLNRNTEKYLQPLLLSVKRQTYANFEVLIVDNGSTDGSVDLVRKDYPWVQLIECHDNMGFSQGNNIGLRYARGQYIAFLNVDMEIDSSWLEELVSELRNDMTIGAAQGKQLQMFDKTALASCGGFIDFYGLVDTRGVRLNRGGRTPDDGHYDYRCDIFFGAGASLLMRRKVLDEIGLFDRKFFLNYEDVDLCWKVWLVGYRVAFVPTAVAFHAVGSVTNRLDRSVLAYHSYKNHLATLLKNYDLKNATKAISGYALILLGWSAHELVKGAVRELEASLGAIIWNLRNFRYLWNARLRIQRARRRSDEELFEMNLIRRKPFALTVYQRMAELHRLSWSPGGAN